jgi:hypothetical protein
MLVIAYVHSLLAESGFLSSLSITALEIAYTSPGYRLNYHLSGLIGVFSILWSGHLAIPYSRAHISPLVLKCLIAGDWISFSLKPDATIHVHASSQYSGASILTFIGGFKSATYSLHLTDIAHRHLALGAVALWASHVYASVYNSIGHRVRDIASTTWISSVSNTRSLDLELSISLAILAQVIQAASGKALYGYSILSMVTHSSTQYSLETTLLPIGPSDFIAHHAIALGLHTTVLILVKGSLEARGSRLVPDKHQIGLAFPCDGPGRGGTCDTSMWDSTYLAMFWTLNTIAWTLFYFHWKNLTVWQNNISAFEEGAIHLMAWFRDYLWFNSAPLIRGYSIYSLNDTSIWAWTFLSAHLC